MTCQQRNGWGVGVLLAACWLGVGCAGPALSGVRGDVGAFSTVVGPGVSESMRTVGADYRIGVPDRVTVRCDRVRGLDLAGAAVDAQGYVAVPTLGRVKVAGLTASEASEALTRRVRTVDSGATMTLEVSRYASRHVYAFGRVASVGPVSWRPGLTLAEVLSETGVGPGASLREVSVIRPGFPGSAGDAPRRVTVDFARLLESGDASVNVVLRAGDVVVVPGEDDNGAARAELAAWTTERASPPTRSARNNEATTAEVEDVARWEASASWPVSGSALGPARASEGVAARSAALSSPTYFGTPGGSPIDEGGASGVVFWN